MSTKNIPKFTSGRFVLPKTCPYVDIPAFDTCINRDVSKIAIQ